MEAIVSSLEETQDVKVTNKQNSTMDQHFKTFIFCGCIRTTLTTPTPHTFMHNNCVANAQKEICKGFSKRQAELILEILPAEQKIWEERQIKPKKQQRKEIQWVGWKRTQCFLWDVLKILPI